MHKILFKETQHLIFVVVVFLLLTIGTGVLCIVQVLFNHPVGNHPASNALMLTFFAGCSLGLILSYYQKLILIITEDDIYVDFGWLTSSRRLKYEEIKHIKLRKYNALKEFKGWGVRLNNNNESCFTVSGNMGLEIALKNNEIILVGTRKSEKMQALLAFFDTQTGSN